MFSERGGVGGIAASGRAIGLGLLLLASACTSASESGNPGSSPAEVALDSIAGVVRIVGSAPVNVQVVVQPAAGTAVRVTGRSAAEIARLAGAEVLLRGTIEASPDPLVDRQIVVSDYRIVSVNGQPVLAGVIIGLDGNTGLLRTDGGIDVTLMGVPPGFVVGQKVWVQGVHSLAIQSYGVIGP
jgi:hypothetical protein